jgi:hypothetical protein
MALAIGASTGVSSVNRWASRGQCHGLRRPAVVLQRTEQGILVLKVARVGEGAAVVAAQVMATRSYSTEAVSTRIVRDDTILECDSAKIHTDPPCIAADGAVTNRQCALKVLNAADAVKGYCVSGNSAVVDEHRGRVRAPPVENKIAPPTLPVIVLWLIVNVPRFHIPPPSPFVLFFLMVLPLIVITPVLKMPPPSVFALFPTTVLVLMVRLPWL